MFPLELVMGLVAVIGVLLLFSALSDRRRHDVDLTSQLRPEHDRIGDEAEEWLERQPDI
jgi:hypothetical protein